MRVFFQAVVLTTERNIDVKRTHCVIARLSVQSGEHNDLRENPHVSAMCFFVNFRNFGWW